MSIFSQVSNHFQSSPTFSLVYLQCPYLSDDMPPMNEFIEDDIKTIIEFKRNDEGKKIKASHHLDSKHFKLLEI